RLNIVPLSDERAPDLLAPMTADERLASIHTRFPDGSIRSAGSAAIALGLVLPGLRHLASMTQRSSTATRLVERAYRAVANHRHQLARFVRDREVVIRWIA
ncbi:MAG: hypothetical protein LC674_05160, partial [Actinobacteria bacterium]|nr:hypothetical protein [Actinomycetota bacterium]